MLAPDTSHGTNPASVTMAGYEVVKVATNERGGVEMDDLRAKVDDDVACLMLTNPNTLGLFDENIAEIAALIHEVGGDALLRRRQPQRGDGPLAARRHGLRHRPRQPAQVVQPAARRRRPGRRADRRLRADRALPAAARRWCGARATTAAARSSTSTSTGPSRSAACAASRATSASSSAPTPTSSASAPTASPRPRRPRC